MNVIIAIAIAATSQWPGAWTYQEAEEAAVTLYAETQAEGLYETANLGEHTCVAIVGSVIQGEPLCFLRDSSMTLQEQILELQEQALLEVLKSQGRLADEP
jgi:hypothetical protein